MEVGSVYGSYYETAKSYMGLRKEEKQAGFAEKVTDKSQVSSEDMTLEEYKEYFNEKMNSLYTHPSQRNRNDIIDITDAAYKRMQTDPEYEKKILDALAKNKAVNFGNYIPQISYMHIDDTYEKCYGYTQGMKENDGYSGSSSAKGTDAGRQKKARQKELLEEYLEKRAQMKEFQQEALEEKIAKQEMLNKKIAKMELERSRQTQSWNSERQMAKASNAYDANIMMEAELVKNITKGENNGKDKVQEYYEKLCKKFPEITFNTGSSLMSGNENKVVINLSSECLKKMANDPEFAKKVEFNLTGAVPGQNRMFAQAKADNAVIHGVTTVIDADGNASVTCGGMTRTSGSKQNSTILNAEKKQKERLQKKREERKISEEKAAKRRAEKKAQLEKLTEDETFTISATGTDVKSVTQNLLAAVSGTSAPTGASFDIKA